MSTADPDPARREREPRGSSKVRVIWATVNSTCTDPQGSQWPVQRLPEVAVVESASQTRGR